jgi:hypothetical protein
VRPYDIAAPAPGLDLGVYLGTTAYYVVCGVGFFLAALACLIILSLLRETDDLFPELEAWAGIVRVRQRGLITYDWRLRLLLWWRRTRRRWARRWNQSSIVATWRVGRDIGRLVGQLRLPPDLLVCLLFLLAAPRVRVRGQASQVWGELYGERDEHCGPVQGRGPRITWAHYLGACWSRAYLTSVPDVGDVGFADPD